MSSYFQSVHKENNTMAVLLTDSITKGALQERSVNRAVSSPMVNSDWAVYSGVALQEAQLANHLVNCPSCP